MAELLRKTPSNQSITGPLHVWCYYQNEEKITMTTFYFIDALWTKVFFTIFPMNVNVEYFRNIERHPCGP